MRHRNNWFSILAGVLLISCVCIPLAHASGETLLLSINSALPGGTTTAFVTIANTSDIESFSLTLYYSSGTVLSLPATNWFTRGDYFPSVPFGTEELNKVQSSTQKKIYFSGFSPAGATGNVGAITFNVSSQAVNGDTQVLSISGDFFSKAEKTSKQFIPGSVTFTVGVNAQNHTLTVNKSGGGTGVIKSSPVGIDCGSDCSESYPAGTQIMINATPDAGSLFSGFSGGCSGTATCIITLNDDTTVGAVFSINTSTSTLLPTTTSSVTAATTSVGGGGEGGGGGGGGSYYTTTTTSAPVTTSIVSTTTTKPPASTTTVAASTTSASSVPVTSTTTTTAFTFCPAKAALGTDSPDLALLYSFRDEVLAESATGQRYRELYYKHALELTLLLKIFPEMEARSRTCIIEMFPAVIDMVRHEKTVISAEEVQNMVTLIDALALYASPSLQEDLRAIKMEIKTGVIFKGFGVEVCSK